MEVIKHLRNIVLLAFAAVFFVPSGWAVELKAAGAGPFKVTVTPSTNQVQLKKTFTLELKVRNVSRTKQVFETLACSWYVNWTMESEYLQFPTWDCETHPSYKVVLTPGSSWTNHLEMTIGKSIPTNRVTFRVGFSPEIVYPNQKQTKPPKYYWSAPVTLEVGK